MTLQQEAHKKIDQLSDDGLRVLIDLIDKIKIMSISGFKEANQDDEKILTEQSGKASEVDNGADAVAKMKDADLFPIRPVAAFPEEDDDIKRIRAEKKKKFMASAGKIDIDEEAIREFRERSMV